MISWPKRLVRGTLLLAATLGWSAPVLAQEAQPGRTPTVAETQVGERQTREQAAPNIEPTQRISNRIQNRVQNRIRNRIDRNYNPEANTTSPFDIAAEQANAARRRAQRR